MVVVADFVAEVAACEVVGLVDVVVDGIVGSVKVDKLGDDVGTVDVFVLEVEDVNALEVVVDGVVVVVSSKIRSGLVVLEDDVEVDIVGLLVDIEEVVGFCWLLYS